MCAEHELTFVYDKHDDVAWLADALRFFKDWKSSSEILAPQDTGHDPDIFCMIQTSFASAVRSQAPPGS